MSDSSRTDYFELADYAALLRRRAWIVIVLACLGALGGVAYAKTAPKTYTASAEVEVLALPNNTNQTGGRTSGLINMDNAAQLVQSVAVATIADKRLHSTLSPRSLVKQVSVAVPPNTTYLQISCASATPGAAAHCANAFAIAFLQYRTSSAAASLAYDLSALQARISRLPGRISALRARLRRLPAHSATKILQETKLHEASKALRTATSTYIAENDLLISLSTSAAAGTITTPAVPPTAASSPRLLLVGPTGLVAGLLIGLVIAYFKDRGDRRIHSVREVERFLDVPVLLDAAGRDAGSAAGIASPRSRTGQAFTELGQYVAASLGDGNHVLLVVGASPGPGSSLVATNLAVTLAWSRSDVVLVCADRADTVAPRLLGVANGLGLAEVLAGSASVPEVAVQPAGQLRLRVIPPGMDTPTSHLQYDACRRLIAELRRDAGYVIIEVQSAGPDAETFALAEFADAAIVAVEVGRTQRPDAEDCLLRMERLRTPVLGAAVLSGAQARQAARTSVSVQPARVPQPPPRAASPTRPADRAGQQRFAPDQSGMRPAQQADAGHGHVHLTAGQAEAESGIKPRRRTEGRPPRVDATLSAERRGAPAEFPGRTDNSAGG
jgi:uncharacterized protein involved in exopolysaccharide biosynthesis/Mrp family chromosome partitioning ATPase